MTLKHTYPYVPNMEDCRKIIKTKGCTCYIMDTICKHMTPEDKAAADKKIIDIYVNSILKREYTGPA